jgi:hypothetical protein
MSTENLAISEPWQAIERIARSEDRMLAIQFFLFFSRFEYALKCINRIKKGTIFADWDGYAASRESVWLNARENAEFKMAMDFLEKSPPLQQDYKQGQLIWKPNARAAEAPSLSKAFAYVRTVRNNLFHGSKFDGANGKEMSRDRDLIRHCPTILNVCLEGDRKLRSKFLDGLY